MVSRQGSVNWRCWKLFMTLRIWRASGRPKIGVLSLEPLFSRTSGTDVDKPRNLAKSVTVE